MDVKHIFDRSPLPICDSCGVRVTAEHLLLNCTKYLNSRQLLISYLREKNLAISMSSVLSNSDVIYLVIDFLKKNGLVDKL